MTFHIVLLLVFHVSLWLSWVPDCRVSVNTIKKRFQSNFVLTIAGLIFCTGRNTCGARAPKKGRKVTMCETCSFRNIRNPRIIMGEPWLILEWFLISYYRLSLKSDIRIRLVPSCEVLHGQNAWNLWKRFQSSSFLVAVSHHFKYDAWDLARKSLQVISHCIISYHFRPCHASSHHVTSLHVHIPEK